MIHISAPNFDNEKKQKQNVLQLAKWFPRYNKKHIPCELELDSISISESIEADFEIRRPLLARGTKAAGVDLIALLKKLTVIAIQLAGYASMSLEGSNRDLIGVPRSRTHFPSYY